MFKILIISSILLSSTIGYGQIEYKKVNFSLINNRKNIAVIVKRETNKSEEEYLGLFCRDTSDINCSFKLRKDSLDSWSVYTTTGWNKFYSYDLGVIDNNTLFHNIQINKISDTIFQNNKLVKFSLQDLKSYSSPPVYYFSSENGIIGIRTSNGFFLREDLPDIWWDLVTW